MLIQTITRWKAYSSLAREKQISHSHSTVKEATLTAHLWVEHCILLRCQAAPLS